MRLAVLGSTGSVGSQTLDVAARLGVTVTALSASRNIAALEDQIRRFRPKLCAVADEDAAADLKSRIADLPTKLIAGKTAAAAAAADLSSDTVLNAVSGIAGLRPTLAAVMSRKRLLLANKESLVAAGDLVISEVKKQGVTLIPVDSEHSAIFQCLQGSAGSRLRRIILTCSGGPFYGYGAERQKHITLREAMAHPTWKMGPKITVDSATLMNKGFEVLEAAQLFGVSRSELRSKIEVTVHRESIVHSMVEFEDRSVLAQLGCPDMRLCVMYALTWPYRLEADFLRPLDFASGLTLSFAPPDEKAFGLLGLAYRAGERGGAVPAALNGANEAAVGLFLDGRIGFRGITESVCAVTERFAGEHAPNEPLTLEGVEAADLEARGLIYEYFGSGSVGR